MCRKRGRGGRCVQKPWINRLGWSCHLSWSPTRRASGWKIPCEVAPQGFIGISGTRAGLTNDGAVSVGSPMPKISEKAASLRARSKGLAVNANRQRDLLQRCKQIWLVIDNWDATHGSRFYGLEENRKELLLTIVFLPDHVKSGRHPRFVELPSQHAICIGNIRHSNFCFH